MNENKDSIKAGLKTRIGIDHIFPYKLSVQKIQGEIEALKIEMDILGGDWRFICEE